ncbi:uncharacterized protein LOC126381305 [Pectinophora gossypiella]|uniref:uncharacterized protein LOC126381305 n=1 Tax=Pectinophora gossypiella TaxID=13191 RepID=UPI00214E3132|nr:uncharacterized protein LOC126381305 [Pectinophora gossypiella]
MSVGKLEPFKVMEDSWNLYVDRLEQYFLVNSVKEEFKVATLITVMGGESYELLVTLCSPNKPSSKTFKELVKIMQDHLQPKPFFMAERYIFRRRQQTAEELVAEYATVLKRLAKNCEFGTELDNNLRDQFCCGLYKEQIRQRVFSWESVTFAKAYQTAVTMEAAEANAAAVMECGRSAGVAGGSVQTTTVQRVGSERERPRADARRGGGPRGGSGGTRGGGCARSGYEVRGTCADGANDGVARTNMHRCRACGGAHDSTSCKFKVYTCRVCNREGHLKKMCPRLKAANVQVHNVQREDEEITVSDGEVMEVKESGHGPYKITPGPAQTKHIS